MNEGHLWHCVFRLLPPVDLLTASRTCTDWCELARADASWITHKTRVLAHHLYLDALFQQFEPTGKRVKRIAKRRRASAAPMGSWFVFVRYLMMNSLVDKLLSFRREAKWKVELVIRAVCNSDTATVDAKGEQVRGFRAFSYNVGGWTSVQHYWFRQFGLQIKGCAEDNNTQWYFDRLSVVFTQGFARIVLL